MRAKGVLKPAAIKKAYNNLKFIVFQNRFLIPQRPTAPQFLYNRLQKIFKQQIWDELFRQHHIQSKSQAMSQFHEKIKQKISENDPLYQSVSTQFHEELQKYKQQVQRYQEKYIKPAKLRYALNPYLIFCAKEYAENKINQPITLQTNVRMGRNWAGLSEKERAQFLEHCERIRDQKLPILREYIQKYQIPCLQSSDIKKLIHYAFSNQTMQKHLPALVAMSEEFQHPRIQSLQQQFEASQHLQILEAMAKEQQKLTLSQQGDLKSKSNVIVVMERFIQYHHFLQRRGITHSNLVFCDQICKQYSQVMKQNRKTEKANRNLIKNLKQLPDEIEPEDPTTSTLS